MLLLLAMMGLGAALPAQGIGADILRQITFWTVALLFFLYCSKLASSALVRV